MGTGDEAVMNHARITVREFERCGLDGVYVANEVSDGHIGRSELLYIALFSGDPPDRGVIAGFCYDEATLCREGMEGVFWQFGPLNSRDPRV
jgi:hypothetical protein